MTTHKLGPYTTITCSIIPGMSVKIKDSWGKKLGGKTVKVLDVLFFPNCEGSFMMLVDGYDNRISVNWASEIVNRQLNLQIDNGLQQ